MDECGFALNLLRLYGWCPSDQRLAATVPFQRGQNRSVLGAFCLSGMVATFTKLGSIKRVDFETFLAEQLLPRLPVGSVLVLDNARIHHGGTMEELVAGAGCSVLYLPAYSPDFSPIELAWGWIKGLVRKIGPRSDIQREEAIREAVAELPKEFAKAWFRKCGYHQD